MEGGGPAIRCLCAGGGEREAGQQAPSQREHPNEARGGRFAGPLDVRLELAARRLRADMYEWFDRCALPTERRLSDLTLSMIGDNNKKRPNPPDTCKRYREHSTRPNTTDVLKARWRMTCYVK